MEPPLSPLGNNVKKKIICILLCAGEGTRIRNHIENIPKALISLAYLQNKPILYDTINKLLKFDIEKLIIITGYLKQNIEEYVKNLTFQPKNLKDKILLFDSGFEYRKGSLYSFLSFTRNTHFFKEDKVYILLPGDTIFDFSLLNEIFSQINKLINKKKSTCVIPFRKIKIGSLKGLSKNSLHDSKIFISFAKSKSKNKQKYLKKIIQRDLSKISKKKDIFQIIPCFMFNFNFIQKIKNIIQKSNINSVREVINLIAKKENNIYLLQIDQNLGFIDIDTYEDLQNLNNTKKGGQ